MTIGKDKQGVAGGAPTAELSHLLDVWGGSPSRWPPPVSRRIATLTASGPEAQALLAEARMLDRLLDGIKDAPAVLTPAAASALVDRITAAAGSAPVTRDLPDNVVRMPVRVVAPAIETRQPVKRWHAAGLIAASLLVGILIGGTLNLTPVFQDMAESIDPANVAALDDLGEDEIL